MQSEGSGCRKFLRKDFPRAPTVEILTENGFGGNGKSKFLPQMLSVATDCIYSYRKWNQRQRKVQILTANAFRDNWLHLFPPQMESEATDCSNYYSKWNLQHPNGANYHCSFYPANMHVNCLRRKDGLSVWDSRITILIFFNTYNIKILQNNCR